MCGVVGALVLNNDTFRVTAPYLDKMRDVMAHRGPDGAGTWVSDDGQIGLAHRRLSIIDLSDAAAQPMANHDRTLWVSYNGEIYNHAEIRRELEAIGGHVWKTDHSDTEVLLNAFRQWGIECVHRFRGMFAFALWDTKKQELWLVRDRVGIKPLYYSIHHGRLTFASEIKALLEDPDQQRAVNKEGMYHFLSFLTTPAPLTMFEGIGKIPGGTWLRIKPNGDIREQRYWDAFDAVGPVQPRSEGEIAENLLSELRQSVQLRKVSDVPVGVFLSGGVDSSTNAALFMEGGGPPVSTFSIGYDQKYESYPSELPYARQVADGLGANYHERLLSVDDLINFLPRMVELQDEPIADPVCVPVYYVSELARQNGVTVCQVGEGADELFFGYFSWHVAEMRERIDRIPVPAFIKHMTLAGMRSLGRERRHIYEWIRRSAFGQPQFWGGAESFFEAEKYRLLSPRLRQEFEGYSSWEAIRPIRQRFLDKAWDQNPVNWMTFLDLNLRLPELLLMRVDKMSMGVSLEGRVPFLDHKFVECALNIPADVRYKWQEPKRILKRAVRGLIPDNIIDRKKQGFGVPIHEWFYDRLGGEMRQTLYEFCDEADLLDRVEIDRMFEQNTGSHLWFLFNFALWWKRFIK